MSTSKSSPKERPMYKAIYSSYERLFVIDCQMREILKFLEEYKSEEAQELAKRLKKCENDFRSFGEFLEEK
jgi:hypothetical protein